MGRKTIQDSKPRVARRSSGNGRTSIDQDALDVLAENMRRQRLKQGISQEALAHASGVHSSEISRIERGAREPRLSTLIRLARALHVTPSELLTRVR